MTPKRCYHRAVPVPLLLLLAVLGGWTEPSARASSPESAVRHYLTTAYEAAIDPATKTADADTKAFEQRVHNVRRVRCIEVARVQIERLETHEHRATAIVGLDIIKREPAEPNVDRWESIPLRVELRSVEDRWLVSQVVLLDDELAEQLTESPEALQNFWNEHPDRATGGLSRAVYRRAMDFLNTAKFKKAAAAATFAAAVAQAAGDPAAESLALGVFVFTGREGPPAEQFRERFIQLAEASGEPDAIARSWYNRGRLGGAPARSQVQRLQA